MWIMRNWLQLSLNRLCRSWTLRWHGFLNQLVFTVSEAIVILTWTLCKDSEALTSHRLHGEGMFSRAAHGRNLLPRALHNCQILTQIERHLRKQINQCLQQHHHQMISLSSPGSDHSNYANKRWHLNKTWGAITTPPQCKLLKNLYNLPQSFLEL